MTAATPALRASSAFTGDGASSTMTVTIPSAVQVGDVIVMVVSYKLLAASGTINTPTGWTLVDGPTANATNGIQSATFVLVAGASDPGSTVTVTGTAGPQQISAVGAAYSGASPTLRGHTFADQGGTASTSVPCSAGTGVPGNLVLLVAGTRANGTTTYTFTAPTNFTVDQQVNNASGGQKIGAFLCSGTVVGSSQTVTSSVAVWTQCGQIVLGPLGSTLSALGS